jgi:hypothetical protein
MEHILVVVVVVVVAEVAEVVELMAHRELLVVVDWMVHSLEVVVHQAKLVHQELLVHQVLLAQLAQAELMVVVVRLV